MDAENIKLVDCHLHLQDWVLLRGVEDVVERARSVGVRRLVCNGAFPADWETVLELSRRFEGVTPFLGVHPWWIGESEGNWLERLSTLARLHRVGIGEAGLDYMKKIDKTVQREVFRGHVMLAKELGRPLNVHCVRAWKGLMEVLREAGELPGGFAVHSFSGSVETAGEIVRAGGYLSFSAWALRDTRRARTAEVLRAIPRERVLAETDSPFGMGPRRLHPFVVQDGEGQEWNEPANLPTIVRELAALAGEDGERFARQTTENAMRYLAPLTEKADE